MLPIYKNKKKLNYSFDLPAPSILSSNFESEHILFAGLLLCHISFVFLRKPENFGFIGSFCKNQLNAKVQKDNDSFCHGTATTGCLEMHCVAETRESNGPEVAQSSY